MESLFDIFNKQELWEPITDNLDLVSYLYTLLISLTFGIILSIVYHLYFQDNEPQDASLSRSLVLLTPSLTTIFWIIQFSIPMSLGLLGTLSFVRFRTPVKRSEDVAFIVIALTVAISCAINKFLVGGIFIVLLVTYSLFRNSFFMRVATRKRFAVVTFNTKATLPLEDLQTEVNSICRHSDFVSARTYDGITSFVFNIPHFTDRMYEQLVSSLSHRDNKARLNVFFPNERLGT